jgi:small-conductance mechanosensitive channel
VPNAQLFRVHIANYTLGFDYIWHEIPMLVTFESDWRRAEEMMLGVLAGHRVSEEVVQAAQQMRDARQEYYLTAKQVEPSVYVNVEESGVQLTARLLVQPWERRKVNDEVWRRLLDGIAEEPSVTLAYPTIRVYRRPSD